MSANPEARANTASLLPLFRSANMALYRSNSGSSGFKSVDLSSETEINGVEDEGEEETRGEGEAGAGSIVEKALC